MTIERNTARSGNVQTTRNRRQLTRTYIASFVGTTIEFYDFIVYGTAASLVFGKVFFESAPPAIGLIASIATLAIGYAARPLGGVIFGHFGDKIGRKSALIWTMSLMGVSTFLIGVLPSAAQAGALAPILLIVLRLVQGIAVGGEYGGAVLISVEHAPPNRRGFFGGAAGLGSGAGTLLAYAVFGALGGLDEKDFMTWGWRLPFLASIVMVGVGLYIRLRVDESPVFVSEQKRAAEEPATKAKAPLFAVLREQPRKVLLAIGVCSGTFMAQAIVSTTLISYATTQFGLSRKSLLDTLNIALVVMIFAIPLFSWLSDKVGRRMVRVPAAALFAVFSFFMFPMLESRSTPIILLAFVISMAILNGAAAGTNGALLSELFPTKYRYTGTSVAYQMAGLIGGGIGPLLAAVFLAPGGPGPGAVAVMTAAFCVVSAVCTVFVGDTRKTDLQNA